MNSPRLSGILVCANKTYTCLSQNNKKYESVLNGFNLYHCKANSADDKFMIFFFLSFFFFSRK